MADIFGNIQRMHQQVREFVEKQFPEYKVTRIDGPAVTKYFPKRTKKEPAKKQEVLELLLDPLKDAKPESEFVLWEVQVAFGVEARSGTLKLSCVVEVVERVGKLGEEELFMRDKPRVSI